MFRDAMGQTTTATLRSNDFRKRYLLTCTHITIAFKRDSEEEWRILRRVQRTKTTTTVTQSVKNSGSLLNIYTIIANLFLVLFFRNKTNLSVVFEGAFVYTWV